MSSADATAPYKVEIEKTLLYHGYELIEVVGSGAYATVFKVRSMKYNEIFCAKAMMVDDGDTAKVASRVRSYEQEITSLQRLSHPNIIQIYDCFTSDHCYYLVLEYCPNGSLAQLISESKITGDRLVDMMKQLASALTYCHDLQVCHRDIKPENVLIDRYGRLKLADFGLAVTRATNRSTERCGSLPYMAPEVLDALTNVDPYACDVWALGITFFQMVTGSLPWYGPDRQTLRSEVRAGCVPYPIDLDPDLMHLLRRMLEAEPARRGRMKEIIGSPFLAQQTHCPRTFQSCHSDTALSASEMRKSAPLGMTNGSLSSGYKLTYKQMVLPPNHLKLTRRRSIELFDMGQGPVDSKPKKRMRGPSPAPLPSKPVSMLR